MCSYARYYTPVSPESQILIAHSRCKHTRTDSKKRCTPPPIATGYPLSFRPFPRIRHTSAPHPAAFTPHPSPCGSMGRRASRNPSSNQPAFPSQCRLKKQTGSKRDTGEAATGPRGDAAPAPAATPCPVSDFCLPACKFCRPACKFCRPAYHRAAAYSHSTYSHSIEAGGFVDTS